MCCAELQVILASPDKDCFSERTVAREKGKKFTLDNRTGQPVCRVKIDNCLTTSRQTRKCDFLFKACGPDKYFLVELKGIDISDAVLQIVSTYNTISPRINKKPEQFKGVVVSSSVPAATDQKFRRLQEKHYREKRLLITKTHFHHTEVVQPSLR
jgi:hypothetical protein